MILAPKNVKYNVMHMPVLEGSSRHGLTMQNGSCGLKVLENGLLKGHQIEAASKIIRKKIKKTGKLWVSIFPSISVTTKSLGVRMGKGKGKHAFWVAPVKQGRILFEIKGIAFETCKEIFDLVSIRLSLKTRVIQFLN